MTAFRPRILVIDDEPQIHRFLGPALDAAGYEHVRADDAAAGLREIARKPPDAVVLDLGLPDMDGKEALARARAFYDGPVIILSARDRETEKIDALDAGADDYVEKPFGVSELLARLRVALRHTIERQGAEATIVSGSVEIDLVNRRVSRDGAHVKLSPKEYDLLACLAGLLTPSEGEVSFRCRQQRTHTPAAYQPKIGIVFQHFALSGQSTLLRNILAGRLARYPWWRTLIGFPRSDREQAWRMLHDLGLGTYAHRRACEVSGGEQQRTALLRALFQEPEIILADEPVSQLDAYLSGRVLGLLRQQAQERQCTVICVLHDASLVERFADYALSLNPLDPEAWRIRAVGPAHAGVA